MFLTQVLVQCQNVQQHQKTELMNKNKRIVEIKNNPGLKITASWRTMTSQIKVLYSQLHGWQNICPAVYACKEKFNSGLTSDLNTAFLYKHQRNTIWAFAWKHDIFVSENDMLCSHVRKKTLFLWERNIIICFTMWSLLMWSATFWRFHSKKLTQFSRCTRG